MSQLQTVLRRSVAHLDPSDHDGRERMVTNAREAMIRLLWSYDPPLTPSEIDSKIEEFDSVATGILQEQPDPDEPAVSDSDESPASSLITPEPEADEAPEPEIHDTPELAAFSRSMALPPREPIRRLARFEPLSQIGSPTPGKVFDAAKAFDASQHPAVPGADAAVIESLTALDNSAGRERPITPAEARSTQPEADPDEYDTDPDAENIVQADEDARDDDLPSEDPDEAGDLGDDELPYPDDEAPLDDEDQDSDDHQDQDQDDRDDDVAPDRLSAEDVLRHHRERFDVRAEIVDDRADEPLDDEPLDENPLDEDEPRRGLGERLREMSETISGRTIAVVAGIVLLLIGGIGGAAYLLSGRPAVTTSQNEPSATAPKPARPTDIAGMIEAEPETPDTQPRPTPAAPRAADAQPVVAPDAAAGALALETLNLFDGRDPSVFQSAPANPVRFEGDTQGGFARVSSSTNSTGSRITVGRGVYERLAGRTIRLVVVARGAKANPASSLRFAYQHGRSLSPWHDGALGADYAPLSTIWTVPKERGGPETDAVLIEPGIPGDGTAADIKSVRIEVLK